VGELLVVERECLPSAVVTSSESGTFPTLTPGLPVVVQAALAAGFMTRATPTSPRVGPRNMRAAARMASFFNMT
jgi:hypothetical protein